MAGKLCGMLLALAMAACSDDAGLVGSAGSRGSASVEHGPTGSGGAVPLHEASTGEAGNSASAGSASTVSLPSDAAAGMTSDSSSTMDPSGSADAGRASLVPDPTAAGWQLNEFAKIVDGALQLTPGIDDMNGHERGTAFWPTAIASEGLVIEFDAEIIPIPQRFHGDGMTLALADVAAGAKPTDFGDSGGGLGYSSAPCCTGIKGIAVALDTSMNANDPSANFLGVATGGQIDRITWAVTKTDVPTWFGAKHHIGVAIENGTLTISADGTELLTTNAGTPTIPKQVLVGFTAANGSNKSRHLVSNLVVSRK
jgi:hypothetical protein